MDHNILTFISTSLCVEEVNMVLHSHVLSTAVFAMAIFCFGNIYQGVWWCLVGIRFFPILAFFDQSALIPSGGHRGGRGSL